jgi:hypothetical protein
MNPLFGALFVLVACPLLGAISFQHWRREWWLVEIAQGFIAVGITRLLFPANPEWELIALMGLAAGRFWVRQPGGMNSTIAGYVLHDPMSGLILGLFGLIGTTMFRQTQQITWVMLGLMPLITALRHPESGILILLTAGLSGVLVGMDQKRPTRSTALKVFRADSLDDRLNPKTAGQTASRLARLKQQGFPVPPGWILYPGDDPASLPTTIQPSPESPWLVRSSLSTVTAPTDPVITDLTSIQAIWPAVVRQFEFPARLAVIVQPQIRAAYQGIANCQTPTLKADLPNEVIAAVLDLVARLNAINGIDGGIPWVAWAYDDQAVWILQVGQASADH